MKKAEDFENTVSMYVNRSDRAGLKEAATEIISDHRTLQQRSMEQNPDVFDETIGPYLPFI